MAISPFPREVRFRDLRRRFGVAVGAAASAEAAATVGSPEARWVFFRDLRRRFGAAAAGAAAGAATGAAEVADAAGT